MLRTVQNKPNSSAEQAIAQVRSLLWLWCCLIFFSSQLFKHVLLCIKISLFKFELSRSIIILVSTRWHTTCRHLSSCVLTFCHCWFSDTRLGRWRRRLLCRRLRAEAGRAATIARAHKAAEGAEPAAESAVHEAEATARIASRCGALLGPCRTCAAAVMTCVR